MTRLAALRLAYQLATRVAGVAHFAATMIAVMMRDERVARELADWDSAEHGGIGVA